MREKLAKKINKYLTPDVLSKGATLYVGKDAHSEHLNIKLYALEYSSDVILVQFIDGRQKLFINFKQMTEHLSKDISFSQLDNLLK
jgi:hypothetical protein